MCARLQTAARKRNVSRNHDVVRLYVFDNPVIGRVEFSSNNFECNPSFIRNSHPRVGHQCDVKVVSARNAVHLLFDRARISIDKYVQQLMILTIVPDLAPGGYLTVGDWRTETRAVRVRVRCSEKIWCDRRKRNPVRNSG